MTPALQHLHEQHKQRIARINARAWRPPVVEVVAPPEPDPPIEPTKAVKRKRYWPVVKPPKEDFAPRVRDIQESLAEHFSVLRMDLISERRDWPVVRYRQLGFLLSKELTPLSTIRIGRYFGGKDHTTVLHGIKKAKEFIRSDPAMKEGYEAVKSSFGAYHATP